MEMILLAVLPAGALLLVAVVMIVLRVTSFWQASGMASNQRGHRRIVADFLVRMAAAQSMLSRRGLELEAAALKLKANNDELARLNEMKNKFLSMAVHDVRNPLGAARGYADILYRSGRLEPADQIRAQKIIKSADQVAHLIDDLTDLALIESGKLRIARAPFPLEALIADVVAPISFVAEKKGVKLNVTSAQGETVVGDKVRIGRVLGNLLGNAVKFTPAGGSVDLEATMGAGGKTIFRVRDTGPGIHPSERARIFEKFYQSRFSEGKAKQLGWGLGLAIADEIVRGHGGRIGVDSAGLGRGSTFWFDIPVPRRSAVPARLMAAVAALFVAAAAAAQVIPLDEKSKFDRALEERVESVLSKVVGPNRTRVVVDATLDFTRIERYETKEGTTTYSAAAASGYLWNAAPETAAASKPELLPGIALPEGPGGASAKEPPRSYEKRNSFPAEFIKRLSVTLVIDEKLDAARGEALQNLVNQVLDLKPDRGDSLSIVRARFEPVWRTLWYQADTAAQVFKYLLLTVLALVTIVAVSICMLQLASAMREMAQAQSQQYAMEMSGGAAGGAGGTSRLEAEFGEKGGKEGELPGPASEKVRFTVLPEQVEALADMVSRENPANIALIAEHLDEEIRVELFHALPPELVDRVMAAMAKITYVEPDVLYNLKEELERRLSGAVGGLAPVRRMLERLPLFERTEAVYRIEVMDAELARSLRARLFTTDSLLALDSERWSLLVTRLSSVEWGAIAPAIPEAALGSLKSSMSETAWLIVQQSTEGAKDAELRRAAETKLERAVRELSAPGADAKRGE